MPAAAYIAEDLVKVVGEENEKETIVLAWGDPVEVLGEKNGRTRVQVRGRDGKPWIGTVKGKLPTQPKSVLQFSMVDVQQGDGMVLQTPEGKVLFIDGGDNKLFARYAAARFGGTSQDQPLEVEAMLITHGDADHFAGLSEIVKSETHKTPRKRLFLHPRRVFHNGLVKGPEKLKVEQIFGRTVETSTGRAVVDLVDDLREAPAARMNTHFKRWAESIRHWAEHGPIEMRRLAFGDGDAFDFLSSEGIKVSVYGPIPQTLTVGGKKVAALPLLHTPPKTVALPGEEKSGAFSASHTINGHSVVLRLEYGNVRFLLSGDLNQESMEALRKKVLAKELESEILKVPHHGSADFDQSALEAIAPVVSLISSGDESAKKEYIHPRATLMGALGRASRGNPALVFCTELAAFFAVRGLSVDQKTKKVYFGFERTSFGIIHVRTDGERVLVFTHSGKAELKEAYRFDVDAQHQVEFAADVKKR
ncbi:MAG: competence protein [Acidobacteria bacterium]|nr:competence protein [Acidobacteriota bacterium]